MAELFAPTLADMIACAKREVAMREHVYPRRVADGKMRPTVADRELETMRAIVAALESLKERDHA